MTGQPRGERIPNRSHADGSRRPARLPVPGATADQTRDYRRGIALVLAASAGLWATLFLLLIGLD